MKINGFQWEKIFSSMPDAVAVVDRACRFVWVNNALETFLGLPREKIIGQHCYTLLHKSAEQPVDCLFRRMEKSLRRESIDIEIPEKKTWIKVTVDPVFDAGGCLSAAIHYLSDITPIKEAERAINLQSRQHEELAVRMVSLMNNMPGAVYRGLRDWSIVFISADIHKMTGYAPEEFQSGRVGWRSVMHPDDLERIRLSFREAVQERRKVLRVEYRLLHKEGGARWISDRRTLVYDEDGKFLHADGLLLDIEDRKVAEEALKETHDRLQSLIESSPTPILALTNDGIVTMWNPAAEKVFGWTSEELLGQFLPIVPNEREFRKLRERVIREGGFSGLEVRRQRKDGSLIDVRLSGGAIRDSGGIVVGMMGMYEDITENKRIAKALRESEEQLQQSQKIEAIGQLAGGVAHDFNNLLTAIRGYSDLLLHRLDAQSPLRRDVEEIQKAGERAASLTRQLLAFSRKQVLQPKVLDLNAVVAGIEGMLRRLIGEDIDLVVALRPGLWSVKVDLGQTEQVIMNIVVNARDAMPKGGKITIETGNVDLGEVYIRKHAVVNPGSYVMLAINDTGEGMSEETKSHLFEPFFTTKEKGKGTGLGLSTVYGIVKQSGGYIWVYSEMGKGTVFKVYFPRVQVSVDSVKDGEKDPLPRGMETVLVVEDEEVVRSLVRDILKEHGYTVLTASDGEDAIMIGREHESLIHLIITDVVMPKTGGREAVESLAPHLPGVKVLYMSGYTDDAIVHHGVLDPGISFLQKPFTPEALLRKVREVLETPSTE